MFYFLAHIASLEFRYVVCFVSFDIHLLFVYDKNRFLKFFYFVRTNFLVLVNLLLCHTKYVLILCRMSLVVKLELLKFLWGKCHNNITNYMTPVAHIVLLKFLMFLVFLSSYKTIRLSKLFSFLNRLVVKVPINLKSLSLFSSHDIASMNQKPSCSSSF